MKRRLHNKRFMEWYYGSGKSWLFEMVSSVTNFMVFKTIKSSMRRILFTRWKGLGNIPF